MALSIEGLNPGIRKLVALLNANGFHTCDSGDGVTHEFGCDRENAYVVMQVAPEHLVRECSRLRAVLGRHGVDVGPICEEPAPCIQGNFDPATDTAFIDLQHVADKDISP